MIRKFFIIIFYSLVTFCVLNFTILLFEIYTKLHIKKIPEINIGFPFSFYSIFWLDANDFHHGVNFNFFLYDILLVIIIVFLYFQLKSKIKK